ncbi:hypothetical protein ABL78_7988 [Leptomonas seymouri]|uniref:C3H1-type domain-containing protein n=1 Tax=Leptomonas seymouri TaxID=5684 RepID=A0A0N1PAY5_LEPSE|nr:hypothetical protein ABL78_7988 [Leptomonas seymouri]|eukprot:KPI82998.1 hypothetical protein ABL78_7988 [Leptomonas seymouri]
MEVSYASSELELSRRESSVKVGSPSGYANASSSSHFQHTNSNLNSSRPDDLEDSRDEEQRRGSGRRGGKRGAARGGGAYSNRICKYFTTPDGCQYGDKCHYLHSGK